MKIIYRNTPTDEMYGEAWAALDDWIDKQTDIDDLWQKTEEVSKVMLDAVWPLIVRDVEGD